VFFFCSLFSCAGVRRISSSAVKLMKVLVAVQRCEYTQTVAFYEVIMSSTSCEKMSSLLVMLDKNKS
jgi:hypothetical protein